MRTLSMSWTIELHLHDVTIFVTCKLDRPYNQLSGVHIKYLDKIPNKMHI